MSHKHLRVNEEVAAGGRGWRGVLLLLVVALAALGGAAAVESTVRATDGSASAVAAGLRTPVLSVRRAPTILAAPIADRRLRADLQAWAAGIDSDDCAVVVDTSGTIVLDHRGNEPVVPASTTKLVTATAALLALGPDARFRTTAVAGGPVVDGTVNGDLVLVGGGDPLLATADYLARFERQPQIATSFESLVQQLVDSGVQRITGSVVGDESRFDRDRYVASWPDRYVAQDQIGPLSALTVNDGWAEYPAAPGAYRDLVPTPDPAAHAAGVLTFLLEVRGVDVVGPPRAGPPPPGAVELAAVESPPLQQVVTQLLQESDNLTAELLMKELGRLGGSPSTAAGTARAMEVLAGAGIDLSGAVIVDGSGLSPDDRATCHLLTDLLGRPETGPLLVEGLPVAGQSGTLTRRFVDTPLAGHLRAKTGSLNSVSSLTGVVEDEDGAMTFAYVANDPSGLVDARAVASAQQALGEILLAWPRVPDASVLGPLPADLQAP